MNNFTFTAGSGLPVVNIQIPWKLSFTLTPVYHVDDPCSQNGGLGVPVSSSIGCESQSLGEDLVVVGTGFQLHYSSDRQPDANANAVASADAAMLGGWTLNIHHAIDGITSTLFLGDGSRRNKYQLGAPVPFKGNFLFTSADSSQIYVFSGATFRHIQTLRPLTGALLYQFGYDAAGKLITITDAAGNVTTIHRDASEHPTSIVSPYGQTTMLALDSNGFLKKVTDPQGLTAQFVNSTGGLIATRTDSNGNVFHYSYDPQGRLIKDLDPTGGFTLLARTNSPGALGWTVTQNTSMGRTRNFQNTITLPWTRTATSVFTQQRHLTLPNGLQASSTTTQQGNNFTKSRSLPDGSSNNITLGPDPRFGLQVPINTIQTLKFGTITMNITNSRTAVVGTAGNPFTLVSQNDQHTINSRNYSSVFTASSRTYVDTSPVGRNITTVLDAHERISSIQKAGLAAAIFTYDTRGRLSTINHGGRLTNFAYDIDGRLASITDALNHKTTFNYDPDGRMTTATLPDARVVTYTHDANGNPTSLTPPGKLTHSFTYTPVDLNAEYAPPVIPGTGATLYSYDTDREITQMTRPDGKTLVFNYDSAGRVKSTVSPTSTIDFTYDPASGLLSSASIVGGEGLAYGHNGPLTTTLTYTGPVTGTLSRVYNSNLWITSESINSANTVSYAYDNDGLIVDAGPLTVTHNSTNDLITSTALNKATDTRTYNSFGELTGYSASYNGLPLYSATYTRDNDGGISAKTETFASATNTYRYAYDLTRRLTSVTKNNAPLSTYAYDTNSNRILAGAIAATYDAQDRLLTYGATSFTYTSSGELTAQTTGAKTTAFTYDVLGNLIAVTLPTLPLSTKITYVIDAENHRIGKKVNGALIQGFLYNRKDQIVAQLNATNAIVSQFVYATSGTTPDYMVQGGVTYRIFSDHLGSPRLIANTSTGAIAQRLDYDEFGNVLLDTNPGFQPFGFAGGLYDQDTKLIRFGARDYSPAIGRWTTKDPLLFAGGDTNLYNYAFADPVNVIDPSGMSCKDLIDKILKHFGGEIKLGPLNISTQTPEISTGASVGVAVEGQSVAEVTGKAAAGITPTPNPSGPLFYSDITVKVTVGKIFSKEIYHWHGEGGDLSKTEFSHNLVKDTGPSDKALCGENGDPERCQQ